jgi:CTP:molybdopterin cytidylyltransferase MocA
MTSGLILAAGSGSRFTRGPKQLADLGGRPLLYWALEAQCAVTELERIVLVLGARAEEILAAVELGRAEAVICSDWAVGQSASLKTGMRALAGSDTVIVTLGDQPLITADTIRRFLGQPAGTRALYKGRPGHPVVLGREQIAAIESLSGDSGARGLLSGGREIECDALSPWGGLDVDTVDDLDVCRRLAQPPM